MRIVLLALLATLALSSFARAEDLVGVRALALQGGRASPNDNASIFLNPAGTALVPRYDFTAFGQYQRNTPDRIVHLSLLDSKTSKELGAGIGWNRGVGKHLPTDDFDFAVAQKYPLGSFGVGIHYRLDRERARRSDVNTDTGFVVDPWEGHLKMAAVSYNTFDPPKTVHNVHRRHAIGLASRWMDLFELTADAVYKPGDAVGMFEWSAGGELTPDEMVSIRTSFGQVPAGRNRNNRVAAGLELVLPDEADLGYTYLLTLGDPQHAVHAAELSVFFF
jgi:hypothetical protein